MIPAEPAHRIEPRARVKLPPSNVSMHMKNLFRMALVVLLFALPLLVCAADVNVQPVDLQREDIEVAITAADDLKFSVAGETVKARKLGRAVKTGSGPLPQMNRWA